MQNVNPVRVLVKGVLLFAIANLAFAFLNPSIGYLTFYNHLIPGRLRFPFRNASGTDISVNNLDVLFASHIISAPKADNEYRVVLLGDSSIWGEILAPDQTLSEKLNFLYLACNGKNVRAYNLGYPHPSLIKDLLILDSSIQYHPDMILWMVTLDTLPQKSRNPFLDANQQRLVSLVQKYKMDYGIKAYLQGGSFWNQTLIGRRSDLASYLLLQVHSFYWHETSHFEKDPGPSLQLSKDLEINATSMRYANDPELSQNKIYLRVGNAYKIAGNVPLVIVNQPMFMGAGLNSDILYNSLYARLGYDQYRKSMAATAAEQNWNYIDLWNAIPANDFFDTPLHLSSQGEVLFAKLLAPVISKSCH